MPSNSFRILATRKSQRYGIYRIYIGARKWIRWISKRIHIQIQSWSLLSKETYFNDILIYSSILQNTKMYNKSLPYHILSIYSFITISTPEQETGNAWRNFPAAADLPRKLGTPWTSLTKTSDLPHRRMLQARHTLEQRKDGTPKKWRF